jgi:hypothetical protein
MRLYWLRILLLCTFAFWASGAAKYAHETLEHHGHDASVDDGDDDEDSSSSVVTTAAGQGANQQDTAHHPAKHPCPICQMLAAMAVDRSSPPALPQLCLRLIGTLSVADHSAPVVPSCFVRSARAPPPVSLSA